MSEKKSKTYTITLREFDVRIILKALGILHTVQQNNREPSRATQYVIDRIYRAMGTRL